MKYLYIGKEYDGDGFRKTFGNFASRGLNQWLEATILSEQPYLADGLRIENPTEETATLLKLCSFFSAVLRDENPEPLTSNDWSLEFEGKHHGLMTTYMNFVRNIYRKANA